LAEELAIDKVLIPPAPGNVSAMGLLAADVRHDFVRTRVKPLQELSPDTLAADFAEMSQQAVETLEREGVAPDKRLSTASVDLRYQGQNYELNLPFAVEDISEAAFAALAERFHTEHDRVYGYRLPSRPVQLVNLRLTAIGRVAHISWPEVPTASGPAVPFSKRMVMLSFGTSAEAPVYRVTELFAGHRFAGPAIVEYPGSTLFVPPGWTATYDSMRNAHLKRSGASGRGQEET
jgi:N-methylhydantoinase A